MSLLTRVFRQSVPIASRYAAYCTTTPTPGKDIEKLLALNKVVVFMKGNPEVIWILYFTNVEIEGLKVLVFFLGAPLRILECRRPNNADARSQLRQLRHPAG